MSLFNQLKH